MRQLRIVFLSHTLRESSFRVGSHHLARELALAGHIVAHISTPVSVLHRLTGRLTRERKMAARRGPVTAEDGVRDYTPRTLLPATVVWSRAQVRRTLNAVGMADFDIAFVDQPLLDHSCLRAGIYIFRPTDVFEQWSSKRRARHALRNSDGLVATSLGVLDSLGTYRGPSMVLGNGVELGNFPVLPGRREGFVYVGAVDFRFDIDAVVNIANSYPTAPIDIYGPISVEGPQTRELPKNLVFHGALPYEEVAMVLASARVGLLPFLPIPRNATRSPMKLYEYLASGLNVLAPALLRSSPGLREAEGVFTYGDDRDILDAARSALAASVPNTAGRVRAEGEDWSAKARELLEFALRTDREGRRILP